MVLGDDNSAQKVCIHDGSVQGEVMDVAVALINTVPPATLNTSLFILPPPENKNKKDPNDTLLSHPPLAKCVEKLMANC